MLNDCRVGYRRAYSVVLRKPYCWLSRKKYPGNFQMKGRDARVTLLALDVSLWRGGPG